MSAAYSPFFCGVPTHRKCTSPNAPASSNEVVNRSRPDSRFLTSSSGSPGSKNGTRPADSASTFSGSTSSPSTSNPSSAMHTAWVAPR